MVLCSALLSCVLQGGFGEGAPERRRRVVPVGQHARGGTGMETPTRPGEAVVRDVLKDFGRPDLRVFLLGIGFAADFAHKNGVLFGDIADVRVPLRLIALPRVDVRAVHDALPALVI